MQRHDADVDDAQIRRAVHLQGGVDDAALVPREHRRRSYDVMHGRERLLDPRRELVVRDLRAGVELAF